MSLFGNSHLSTYQPRCSYFIKGLIECGPMFGQGSVSSLPYHQSTACICHKNTTDFNVGQ